MVRFPYGLQIFISKHTKACKSIDCKLFCFSVSTRFTTFLNKKVSQSMSHFFTQRIQNFSFAVVSYIKCSNASMDVNKRKIDYAFVSGNELLLISSLNC